MPIVERIEFDVEERFSGSLLRHRLTWRFYDAAGVLLEENQQDRDPAKNDEHRTWLQGVADMWTQVTTPVMEVTINV